MIKKIIMAISLLFSGGNVANTTVLEDSKSQSVNSSFELDKKWDDIHSNKGYESYNSVIETSDGGFVVVGETTVLENVSLGDGLIIKYSSEGETEWQEMLLGDDTDLYYDVAEGTDGSFYAVGESFSTELGFDNDDMDPNAIIVKYNNEGEQEWIYNKSDSGRPIGYSDILAINGKLYVFGEKVNNGARTGFLQVIDEETQAEDNIVHFQNDELNTVINTVVKAKDDSLLLVGNYKSVNDSKEVPMVTKIGLDGSEIWSYKSNDNTEGKFNSVFETKDGQFVLGGYTIEDSKTKPTIVLLDETGKAVWENIGEGDSGEVCESVLIDKDNNILATIGKEVNENITLDTDLDISVKKYDMDGGLLESSTLDADNNFKHMSSVYTQDNDLLVVGRKHTRIKYVEGQTLNCKLVPVGLSKRVDNSECIQSDGYILKVGFTNPCDTNSLPVLQVKQNKVSININDEFNPKDYIIATDEGVNVVDNVQVSPSTVDTSVKGEKEITYTFSDECNTVTAKLTLEIKDPCDLVELPTITLPKDKVVINMGDEFNPRDYITIIGDDEKEYDLKITPETIDTNIKGEMEISYTVTDECGVVTDKLTVDVVDPCDDDEVPVLQVKEEKVEINMGDEFNPRDYIIATDGGLDKIEEVNILPETIDTSVEGEIEIVYALDDGCRVVTSKLTLNVKNPCGDNEAPKLTLQTEEVSINLNEIFVPLDYATATDEGVDVSKDIVITPSTIDTSTKGEKEITYTISDECNVVTKKMKLVIVDPCDIDKAPILIVKNKEVKINVNDKFNPLDYVSATDDDKDITNEVSYVPTKIDTSAKGEKEITYTVSDECNVVTETLKLIIEDPCDSIEVPTIKLHDKVLELEKGEEFNPLDYIEVTQGSENIIDKLLVTPKDIDTKIEGETEIVYTVAYECGVVTEKMTLIVVDPCKDMKSPEITIKEDEVFLEIGDDFDPMEGVSATDGNGKDITADVKISFSDGFDLEKEGQYKITYSISTDCSTISKEIIVNVSKNKCELNTLPTIDTQDVVLKVGDSFNPLDGITVTDKEDGNLIDMVAISGDTVNTSKVGEYKIIYEVVDTCGMKVTKERVIKVINDNCEVNEKPVINALDVTLNLGDKFNPLDKVAAIDKELGDLTDSIEVVLNTVNTSKVGEYKVVYKVTDGCVSVEKEIKVIVKDNSIVGGVDDENNESDKGNPIVKPQTGDTLYYYGVVALISLIGIALVNFGKYKK